LCLFESEYEQFLGNGRFLKLTEVVRRREEPIVGGMSETLIATLKPLKRGRKDLVFPDRKDGYLNRNKIKNPFWRIIKQAKLRTIRLHDARHSFASQLVMKGVHLRTVQELLGHSDIRMTERYSHLSPSVSMDAVNMLD
jgi:site-specific recombinase XerD